MPVYFVKMYITEYQVSKFFPVLYEFNRIVPTEEENWIVNFYRNMKNIGKSRRTLIIEFYKFFNNPPVIVNQKKVMDILRKNKFVVIRKDIKFHKSSLYKNRGNPNLEELKFINIADKIIQGTPLIFWDESYFCSKS